VVKLDMQSFTLTIEGEADRPVVLRYEELLELPAVERTVPMSCVGGSREDAVVKGVTVARLFALARVRDTARLAIFSCADGHEESVPLIDLLRNEAFLVYSVAGERVDRLGYPLRLCIPGKYACHWAKGVERVELVGEQRKGCRESRRLSDRANVGDTW
jgi:DMSO/TMAO reductase YedYZ molybdopterin-dependent catalytic subunit